MLFNSPVFLFVFLPVTYLVFWALRTKDQRYTWLALTGYVFYGCWNPKFCFLMLFSTLVSYRAGVQLSRSNRTDRQRRLYLVGPIVIDLTSLGFFKYVNFAVLTWNSLTSWHSSFALQPLNIILPIGISFYTFHTISYIVDSYRRQIAPTRNFWEFACYVSLFSQLVAGPIVRFSELQADLENLDKVDRRTYQQLGWSYFLIGMLQKVILADTVAAVIDPALRQPGALSSAGAWLCMLGYTYQLYFDFAGYSNMAIGLGYLFGMHIPKNFDSPYRALNPSDFWRRWHISLSRCLRDYLYIPLGGNRKGKIRTYVNLMATMLLGGLWHGASWTFVAWGAYHGALMCFYRKFGDVWDRILKPLQVALTFILVVFGWTLFRADTFHDAAVLLNRMLLWQPGSLPPQSITLIGAVLVCAAFAHFGPNASELDHTWEPIPALAMAMLFVLCMARIVGGEPSRFLYFQF